MIISLTSVTTCSMRVGESRQGRVSKKGQGTPNGGWGAHGGLPCDEETPLPLTFKRVLKTSGMK